jgi:hypothetical protein
MEDLVTFFLLGAGVYGEELASCLVQHSRVDAEELAMASEKPGRLAKISEILQDEAVLQPALI